MTTPNKAQAGATPAAPSTHPALAKLREAFEVEPTRWDIVEGHAYHMWESLRETPPLLESQNVDSLREWGERMTESLVDIAAAFLGESHEMVEKCMKEAARVRAVKKEKGAAFDALVKELKARGDVDDPEALAAWIGRKKGKIA